MTETNLEFIRGDSWDAPLTFTSDGSPMNITGATIKFTLLKDGETTPTMQKSITSHTNESGGVSALSIAPTDWANVTVGNYRFDIEITLSNTKKYTVVIGRATVQDDVTK